MLSDARAGGQGRSNNRGIAVREDIPYNRVRPGMAGESSRMVFRLGELFCGPGGIAQGADLANLALREAGMDVQIEHAWATDYHPDTCATYRRNFFPSEPERVVCEDIRTLAEDYDRLRRISEIDALAFGFPCNDFSMVGEQKGINGTFGPLYTYAEKALKHFQPRWFLAENVGGLSSANEGKAFVSILDAFRNCGYNLVPHYYRFEDYGVPQARHRIIIIGVKKDERWTFRVPAPTGELRTARQALEEPPIPKWATNQELTKQSSNVIARLNHILPGQNAFNADLPEHLKLNVRGAKISQIYKRLDPNKPAYTVTGSGGGGTHIYHWDHSRALTNRERARLQTFSDDFVFEGSKEAVRRQIGMAVPPKGVSKIFEAVVKSCLGEEYPTTKPAFEVLRAHDRYSSKDAEQLMLLEKEARKYGRDRGD